MNLTVTGGSAVDTDGSGKSLLPQGANRKTWNCGRQSLPPQPTRSTTVRGSGEPEARAARDEKQK